MKDLYIIGAGGFGREVSWLVERINKVKKTWNIKGYVDDNESIHGLTLYDYPVLGGLDYLSELEGSSVVCAVANVNARKKIVDRLSDYNLEFVTLIDPSVIMAKNVSIGEGTIICA